MTKTIGNLDRVPPEYYDWFKTQTFKTIDKQDLAKRVTEELSMFKNMSTEEYILWQKWEEVNDSYPTEQSLLLNEPAYKDKNHARVITQVKSMLWDGNYNDIEPELVDDVKEHWTALRIMIHSQQHSGAIGRNLNYLVRDKPTRKYLGVISIASDFLDLTPRDEYVGWTREQRTQEQRIQHTAVCSTIVPVQPFGYNYLGGKLLALLCLSNRVQSDWKEQYGSKLVGLTTTSLYGKDKGGHGMSQYDNLRHWKKMGYSTGSSALRMSLKTKELAYEWAKTNIPQDYYIFIVHKDENGMTVRDRLNRFHQKIYRALGISNKMFTSNHDRGIYFAPLYDNTNEFLRNDIPESKLVTKNDYSIEALTCMWKEKYAKRRAEKTPAKTGALFYDDLSFLTWEEARAKYLVDVGR